MFKYLISSVSVITLATPAIAQEDNREAEREEAQITVTATGTRGNVIATGQAVTVIPEYEIEAIQGADLTRILERVPGVAFTRNGGVGGFTGVRIRGAEAEQTLTIVDGVRVADPSSPSGGFDFGNLLATDLSKIEILRGSNSTIWGSDAVGGVIVASTRAETGLAGSVEYGSRNTLNTGVSGGLADSDVGYIGLSGTYFSTDGISAADGGAEADGFDQWAVQGHGRYYVDDRFELFARSRYVQGDLELDGFPFPDFILTDTLDSQETRQWTGSAGGVFDSGPLFVTAAYSFADTERDNLDETGAETFTSRGTSDRVALRGEWRPFGPLIAHFGAEHEWTSYQTLFDAGDETTIFGAYAQGGIEYGGISAHIGARLDDHADFGSAISFGADASIEVADGFRIRASVGEGFKAPSLFQLQSDFGNVLLRPESSTSFDIGVAYGERSLADRPIYAAVTLYRRNTDDLINFIGCFGVIDGICTDRPFGTYDNVARARSQGVEAEVWGSPGEGVTLGAVYSFTDATNRETGLELARRPRHAATFTAEFAASDVASLGLDMRVVSGSFDDPFNLVRLESYQLLTLRGAIGVTSRIEMFGRIENLLDEEYQTAAGFGTAGTSAHIGARLAL